jgi:hypothetical protein
MLHWAHKDLKSSPLGPAAFFPELGPAADMAASISDDETDEAGVDMDEVHRRIEAQKKQGK